MLPCALFWSQSRLRCLIVFASFVTKRDAAICCSHFKYARVLRSHPNFEIVTHVEPEAIAQCQIFPPHLIGAQSIVLLLFFQSVITVHFVHQKIIETVVLSVGCIRLRISASNPGRFCVTITAVMKQFIVSSGLPQR